VRPGDIATEIFLLPAALTPEKNGSYTNTQRLVQWHDKAVEPPGDCRSEAWFIYHLGRRLRALYADDSSPRGRQLQALTWEYGAVGPTGEPDLERVVREINGYTVVDGKPLAHFNALQADGYAGFNRLYEQGTIDGDITPPSHCYGRPFSWSYAIYPAPALRGGWDYTNNSRYGSER
jgi:anaerobic selenocysteine-containing dehydrogenase